MKILNCYTFFLLDILLCAAKSGQETLQKLLLSDLLYQQYLFTLNATALQAIYTGLFLVILKYISNQEQDQGKIQYSNMWPVLKIRRARPR